MTDQEVNGLYQNKWGGGLLGRTRRREWQIEFTDRPTARGFFPVCLGATVRDSSRMAASWSIVVLDSSIFNHHGSMFDPSSSFEAKEIRSKSIDILAGLNAITTSASLDAQTSSTSHGWVILGWILEGRVQTFEGIVFFFFFWIHIRWSRFDHLSVVLVVLDRFLHPIQMFPLVSPEGFSFFVFSGSIIESYWS